MKTFNKTSINLLKSISIIFVIISHTLQSKNIETKFLSSFVLDSAVPVFMIISGFLYSISISKEKSLKKWSQKKFIRFFVPFLCAFLIEIIIYYLLSSKSIPIGKFILSFFIGGIGPGSYYTLIMFEFILIFPIIHKIIKKYDFKGLLICFLLNFIFELIKVPLMINSEIYRLLIFRYIFVIASGSYLSMNKNNNYKYLDVLMFVTGFIFIYTYEIKEVKPIVFNQWTSTCMIACLFWFPIVKKLINSNLLDKKIIDYIGKSTYNIYLVQMVYFFLNPIKFLNVSNIYYLICINIVVCVIAGLLFQRFEQPITTKLINRSK